MNCVYWFPFSLCWRAPLQSFFHMQACSSLQSPTLDGWSLKQSLSAILLTSSSTNPTCLPPSPVTIDMRTEPSAASACSGQDSPSASLAQGCRSLQFRHLYCLSLTTSSTALALRRCALCVPWRWKLQTADGVSAAITARLWSASCVTVLIWASMLAA